MLVQSGKPVGVMQTHEWAPRVLLANSNLVGDWANWEEFRRLERPGPDHVRADDRRLLDLHRHPGHPAGHLRDLRRRRREEVRRHPGRDHHPDRGSGRHGRRAAAGRHHERRRGHLHRLRPARDHPPDRAPLPGRAGRTRWTTRCELAVEARDAARAAVHRRAGQRRRAGPAAAGDGRADRHRHRPDLGPRPAGLPAARRGLRRHEAATPTDKPAEFTQPGPRGDGQARRGDGRLPGRGRRGLRLRQLDPRRGPAGRLHARLRLPRLRPGLHPAAVLRGQGPVPLGRAVRRPARTSP